MSFNTCVGQCGVVKAQLQVHEVLETRDARHEEGADSCSHQIRDECDGAPDEHGHLEDHLAMQKDGHVLLEVDGEVLEQNTVVQPVVLLVEVAPVHAHARAQLERKLALRHVHVKVVHLLRQLCGGAVEVADHLR